jgi:glutamate:GABA antiporter
MSAPAASVVTVSQSERSKLHRELRRFDTVFFLMSAMVVVDTVGAIAVGGGQAFTWLIVLFVTFFIPSALCSAELGAALPEEGGAYVWVRTAFGGLAGSMTSLFYWASTPLWLGGSVTAVAMAVYRRFLGPMSTPGMYAFGAVFVMLATVAAIVPLRLGKWVPTSGAIGQIALLVVFTFTVVLYGIRHGVQGIAVADLSPSASVLIAIVPVLIYSFTGVELPSTAAEEMIDPIRDIPVAIARAGIGQLLMYGIPTLAILLVLPVGQLTSLHGLVDAMERVFTVYGGTLTADGTPTLSGGGAAVAACSAVLFIWVLLASGSAWIMGAGRAQAAACLDGGGPPRLGRISSRTGVPVTMALVSGGVSLAAMVTMLFVADGDGQQFFSVALSSAISMVILAYLFVFPAFLRLRRSEAGLHRPFIAPGGRLGAVIITTLATGWTLVAACCLLWPGIGTADPDASLPLGFDGRRMQFELLMFGPVVVVLGAVTLYHWVSRASPPPADAHALDEPQRG